MRRSAAAAVVVWAQLAGCLPEGGPGVGRQLLAERGLADLTFSRESPTDPGSLLLFTRASATTGDTTDLLLRDLFQVSRDGGEPRLRALRLPSQVRSSYFWDGLGRLYLHRDIERRPAAERGLPALVSWDLLTLAPGGDDVLSMGRVRLERLSPSRTRLFCQRPDGSGFVRDVAGGGDRPVGATIRQSLFVGEDLTFIDDDRLGRLAADAAVSETLLSGVRAFRPVSSKVGDVVVRRPSSDSRAETVALVRMGPDGPAVTELGSDTLVGDPFVSPDGRVVSWVAAAAPGQPPDTVNLAMRRLTEGQTLRLPVQALPVTPPAPADPTSTKPPPQVDVSYRPGSDEAWFSIDLRLFVASPAGETPIVRPVNTVVRIGPGRSGDRLSDDQPSFFRRTRASLFTADGRRWIFQGSDARHHLGDAVHPDVDGGIAVSTIGAASDLYEIEGGRRLAVWLSPGSDRIDLYLLDVEQDRLRFLAADVGATTFGEHRVLAIARKLGDRRATGDLVLLDFATGAETLLAQNVSEFAVPSCAGCDPTAPGMPFAYVVQARVPWRYEGLWTGELP